MKKRRIFFETEEVVQKTKKGYVDLDMDYFQFYETAFSHVASLSSNCSKDFILWVMSKVDQENRFRYSKDMLARFNQDLQKITKPKSYAESTMNMALKELVDVGIISRAGRGEYQVSPKLFWTTDVSDRVTMVKEMEAETKVLGPDATPKFKKYSDLELGINPDNPNNQ